MVLSESGVDLDSWREELKANAQPTDLKAFGDALAGSYIPNRCGAVAWVDPAPRRPLRAGRGAPRVGGRRRRRRLSSLAPLPLLTRTPAPH
jgi:hypothetical protein